MPLLLDFEFKCKISVAVGQVSGSHVNFPILLTQQSLPLDMFGAGGISPAQNGGADIRFSTDEGGLNQIAAEIGYFETDSDPANGSANIWVKLPILIAATEFYIWWGNSSVSMPSATSTYGSQAVWSEGHMIVHLNNIIPVDSTGQRTLTNSGATLTTGKFGNALEFSDTNHSTINTGIGTMPSGDFAISCWIKPSVLSGYKAIMGDYDPAYNSLRTYVGLKNNDVLYDGRQNANNLITSGAIVVDQDVHLVFTRTGSDVYVYANGGLLTASPLSDNVDAPANLFETHIGSLRQGASTWFIGSMSEVWVENIYRNTDYIVTEYANQNDPSVFFDVGGVVVNSTILLPYNIKHDLNSDESGLSEEETLILQGTLQGFISSEIILLEGVTVLICQNSEHLFSSSLVGSIQNLALDPCLHDQRALNISLSDFVQNLSSIRIINTQNRHHVRQIKPIQNIITPQH